MAGEMKARGKTQKDWNFLASCTDIPVVGQAVAVAVAENERPASSISGSAAEVAAEEGRRHSSLIAVPE